MKHHPTFSFFVFSILFSVVLLGFSHVASVVFHPLSLHRGQSSQQSIGFSRQVSSRQSIGEEKTHGSGVGLEEFGWMDVLFFVVLVSLFCWGLSLRSRAVFCSVLEFVFLLFA